MSTTQQRHGRLDDWNILLDETGGPNHVGKPAFAPCTPTQAGSIIYTNSFYYSPLLQVHSPLARVASSALRAARSTLQRLRNPDGQVAAVVLNRGDKRSPTTLGRRPRRGV